MNKNKHKKLCMFKRHLKNHSCTEIFLLLGLVVFIAACSSEPNIIYYCMSKKQCAGNDCCAPEAAYSFKQGDFTNFKIYCYIVCEQWFGKHTIQAKFYQPDGALFDKDEFETLHYGTICFDLNPWPVDTLDAVPTGTWKCEVLIDNSTEIAMEFLVEEGESVEEETTNDDDESSATTTVSETETSTTTTAGGNGLYGNVGDVCETDADCVSGMLCLESYIQGPTKYCSPSCDEFEDCQPLFDTAYSIQLPAKFGANFNIYQTDILSRGGTCASVEGRGKYCALLCPDKTNMVIDKDGSLVGCACLPNYTYNDISGACVWNSSVECSIFKPCPAESDYCEGDNTCIIEEDLEGFCYSIKSGDLIEDCVEQCMYDCDENCMDSCYSSITNVSEIDSCANSCCGSDNPMCN